MSRRAVTPLDSGAIASYIVGKGGHMAKKIRILVLAAMIVAGAISLLAAPSEGFYITYYTDDTFTVECGDYYYLCYGSPVREGCRTAYYVYEDLGPC